MSKKKWLILIIILGLSGSFFVLKKQTKKQSTQLTYTVKSGSIVNAVYGIGTVTASKTYQVKVGVAGTLENIYVKEGEFVRAGAPLMRVDNVITAPFSGTVTSIPYKVGENVFPQQPLLTLTDLSDCYINVSLEQEASLQVKKGQKAVLNFESLRDQKFEGRVTAIFSNEGRFWVHIKNIVLPTSILPGMTADVAIQIEEKNKCLLIPVTAIFFDPKQESSPTEKTHVAKVKVLISGKPVEKSINLGIVDADMAEVLSGIQENDILLLKEK